jgi:hypothetical protein
MTTKRLLDLQVELLDYLTSSAAIFGDEPQAALDPALDGIDRGLLRLEARLSYGKRIDKIITVFPRTFEILGSETVSIVRAFVDTCPPFDIGRLANALQFHDFLVARWRHAPPEPRYLPDVAACELACATVRTGAESEDPRKTGRMSDAPRSGIRRHPHVTLLRCAHDIRPIFEEGSMQTAPAERDTPIAISVSPTARHPCVCEVTPAVFDLLTVLDDWADPATFCAMSDTDELVRELADHGLVQVRG